MRNNRRNLVEVTAAVCLLLGGTAIVFSSPSGGRQPVPADAEVAKSRTLVRSAYEDEYRAARQSGDPVGLIKALFDSVETSVDAVRKYSLLLEAEDLAMQHEDVATALAIVDRRAQLFEIDGLQQRAATLERLAGPKVSGDVALLDQAIETANLAAAAERFDIAVDSANLAVSVARSIDRAQKVEARRQPRRPAENEKTPALNGPPLIKAAQELQARITDHEKAFVAYQEATTVLSKDPENVEANAATGKYLCLVAQKWEKGLPYLGKGRIQSISELANEEGILRSASPTDAAKMFALAGKWWTAAGGSEVLIGSGEAMRLHAASMYHGVLPQLKDPLERRLVETRTKDYRPVLALQNSQGPNDKVFVAGGQASPDLPLPNGWTQQAEFIEGIGQVRGGGSRAKGDPCRLRIVPELGTSDFVITIFLSLENVDGTAAGFKIESGRKVGYLGLDGGGGQRNLFFEGDLFGLPEVRGTGLRPKQGQVHSFVITRQGKSIHWTFDGQEVAKMQLSEDMLGAFEIVPKRGHVRIREVRIGGVPSVPAVPDKN